MPISDYLRKIREHVGTDLIMMPGLVNLDFADIKVALGIAQQDPLPDDAFGRVRDTDLQSDP